MSVKTILSSIKLRKQRRFVGLKKKNYKKQMRVYLILDLKIGVL